MWIYESDYKLIKKFNEEEWKIIKRMSCGQIGIRLGNIGIQSIYDSYITDSICVCYKYPSSLFISDYIHIEKHKTLYEYIYPKMFDIDLIKNKCQLWLLYKNSTPAIIKDHMKQDYSHIENFIERIRG